VRESRADFPLNKELIKMKTTYITCEICSIPYPLELMVRKKINSDKEIFVCLNCELEKGDAK